MLSPQKFLDFFTYFKGEQQQEDGVLMLYKELQRKTPELLDGDAPWVLRYRFKPPAPARDPMHTPYFSQNDNASGTGYRECFSSSCAMVAAFYGKVKTDDEYNVIRARYGDTTSSEAQLRALRSLGLKADFHTNGSPARLKELLDRGCPVPVGWLHKGPVSAPSGGGHWSVVIGVDGDRWVVNDPNGEADLVNGGYTANMNGHGQRYSFTNFNRRWEVDGPGTGWYLAVGA